MNYYISDLHFGHANIIKYDAQHGGMHFHSIEEHDRFLIENWNSVVTDKDTAYILGDFSWLNPEGTKAILKKLPGQKVLVRGNHDAWIKDYECRKFFKEICDYKRLKDFGIEVILSHYPMLFYQNQHRGAVHLYGHVHNTEEETLFQQACKNLEENYNIPTNCYNVGCMLNGYTPQTLKQLQKRKSNIREIENDLSISL